MPVLLCLIIYPRVIGWSKLLVYDALHQLKDISEATNVPLTFENLTSEAVSDAFSKLNPNGQAPLLLHPVEDLYATWRQYFFHHRSSSKKTQQKSWLKSFLLRPS